jgi:5-methylcytosine-specific restriction endonuclease McrA
MADKNPIIKVCTKCDQVLSLESFRKNRSRKDGLSDWCKTCLAEVNRAYYLRDVEGNRQKRREYHVRNRDKTLAAFKRYRKQNPEKIKAQNRTKYLANSESIKDRARSWLQQNKRRAYLKHRLYKEQHREHLNACARKRAKARPEARRAAQKKNKAKRAQAPGTCSAEQWLAKIEYHGWRCLYCKTTLTSATMHMEHRKPLSREGSHWPANLAPSCIRCNLSKNNKTEAEFLKKGPQP